MKSYLSGRSQFVQINNTCSLLTAITFGVPQGSILGPLLFLLFINDLPDATSLYVKLFADDTFLCAQDRSFNALESNVNFELEKVYSWLVSNKLTLNINKSKYMIVSKKKVIPQLKICLNGSELEKCESYKYLGVYIDSKLNWKNHIEHITSKIAKSCGALAKIRHYVDTKTLVNIFHALVNSYARYGIIVWGNAGKATLKPLQSMVNKAIRIITFAPFGNIDLKPAYRQLKLLSVENLLKFELAKFTYKSNNDLLPIHVGNYFELSSEQHCHNHFVRNRLRPVRFLSKSKTGEKSVQYKSFQLWKEILPEIKTSSSLSLFKRKYKTFLIDNC